MHFTLLAVLATLCFTTQGLANDVAKLIDKTDKINYSLGYQIGGDFKRQKVDMKADLIVRGIEDALAGSPSLMTPLEMQETLIALKKRIDKLEWDERQEILEKNLALGKAFLAENAKKENVKVLPSGLQYQVKESGHGKRPTPDDTVSVNYLGTLIDGSEFDSSYLRNKPATFRVDQVIPGWIEVLPLMREGGKWQVFVPPELAYGERSTSRIPPNSTLIFEIELLSIGSEEDG